MTKSRPPSSSTPITRRVLLERAAQLGIMGAAAPLAMNLASIGEAAAFNNNDYRALVCVFFYGGNDHWNTVTPYDLPNYDRYAQVRNGGPGRTRGGIAWGHGELNPLTPVAAQTLTDDQQYALAPPLGRMRQLFNSGAAAIQLNVGPLIVPVTRAQYEGSNRQLYPLPPKLFSHNDQQSVWQAQRSEGASVGWGGRMGDLALSSNVDSLFTCISAAGNAVFVAGRNALQYQISPAGAIRINALTANNYMTPQARDALRATITEARTQTLENEFTRVTRRSIEKEGIVNAALAPINLTTPFGSGAGEPNPLANQLRIVARLIGARNTLGAKRQIFFVSLGGFDTHNLLMDDHPELLGHIDEALSAFYAATVELGVADKVTLFTASDFGRTLSSNSDGSDHGWGSHHFVVGGAVNGGRYYGIAPHVSIDTDDQVGQGRLLPSTGVDQFAATLARWFGVSDSEMPTILPNVGNFATSNMGFMRL